MKKFLLRLISFIGFTALGYISLILLIGNSPLKNWTKNIILMVGSPGNSYTRFNEFKTIKQADILFIGSSHAYRGFDTRIFEKEGYKVFNLGSSSQTPIQSRILLEEALQKFTPKLVVLEVYPFTFSSDGLESSLDYISNKKHSKHTLHLLWQQNNIKVFNTFLVSFFRENVMRIEPFVEPSEMYSSGDKYIEHVIYINGGYVERSVLNKADSTPLARQRIITSSKNIIRDLSIIEKNGKWNPKQIQLDCFQEIIKTLNNRAVKYLLIQAPIHGRFYARISCKKEIDTYFSSFGNYHNYNDSVFMMDENNFYDFDHLNQIGVKKMNESVLNDIIKKIIKLE